MSHPFLGPSCSPKSGAISVILKRPLSSLRPSQGMRRNSLGEPRIGQIQAVYEVAHQRPRELKLRAEAHPGQGLRLEFGEQDARHGLHRRVPRHLAAADVGHLAEALALADGVEQAALESDLDMPLGEKKE